MNKVFIEVRDQPHLMVAEGSCDYKIKKQEIVEALLDKGYLSTNISIFKDEVMGFYRFSCNIKKI